MSVTGPDFVSLQVRDLAASAAFYEGFLGFTRQPGPPHAVVFATLPAPFAIREPLPGVDLSDGTPLGKGVGIWMQTPDVQQIHDALVASGVTIASAPMVGPFGLTFTFADLDGYLITLHERA